MNITKPDTDKEIRSQHLRNVHWTADGTSLIGTLETNDVNTFIVPPDLLAEREAPISLAPYSTITSREPVFAITSYPAFQLQDATTALVLSSVRAHPVRLSSALDGSRIASYPLVNPLTEEFTSPHSLAFFPAGTHFVAGSDSLISVFDVSRVGQEPVTSVKTGPKNNRDDRWNPATSMRGIVSALTIDLTSNILAAGTFTRHVALYEAAGQGTCVGSFSLAGNEAEKYIRGGGVNQLDWSSCGRYLYVTERRSDGVMIYDIRQTGQLLSWLKGRNAYTNQRLGITVFQHSSDKSCEVWAGGTDGMVRMWKDAHLQAGEVLPISEFRANEDPVTSTAVHRAGGVIATSSSPQRPSDDIAENTQAAEARLKVWST